MGEWKAVRLDEIISLKRGFDLPEPRRNPGPYPVLGSSGISGWHDEGPVDGPGITIGRSGASIGVATFYEGPYWPLNTTLFVEDFRGNDPLFVYNMLRTLDLQRFNSGSAQPSLNRNYIAKVVVMLPPLYEQKAIASVLGALDNKIAVNQRIALSCDELRSLRLKNHLDGNEQYSREVPLASVAEFVNGRAFTKEASGTGRMVVRIAEINSGLGPSTVYNDIDVGDQHLARPGDILFAWSGSLTVARWYRDEAIINQHIFKVLPKTGMPSWLVFEMVKAKLDDFRLIAADKATTMGHIQRRHLDEPVRMPGNDDVDRLDSQFGPLWERALVAERENLRLVQLRDTLLPKLMSGELRVREAEKVVEEVL